MKKEFPLVNLSMGCNDHSDQNLSQRCYVLYQINILFCVDYYDLIVMIEMYAPNFLQIMSKMFYFTLSLLLIVLL